jgi:hypothetical protein
MQPKLVPLLPKSKPVRDVGLCGSNELPDDSQVDNLHIYDR